MKIIRKWGVEEHRKWRQHHAIGSDEGVGWGCGCWDSWSVLEKRKKKNGAMRVGVVSGGMCGS